MNPESTHWMESILDWIGNIHIFIIDSDSGTLAHSINVDPNGWSDIYRCLCVIQSLFMNEKRKTANKKLERNLLNVLSAQATWNIPHPIYEYENERDSFIQGSVLCSNRKATAKEIPNIEYKIGG